MDHLLSKIGTMHKYMYCTRFTLQSMGGPYFLLHIVEDALLHDAHLGGQR